MNFCGLICEFNPLHNGHEYIIKKAKEITGKELVCLMSGDFVQRGEPAIVSKFERARSAIAVGANAVLELPTIYACSNAENFALGAIKIFSALGIKQIVCGVETNKFETLNKIAELKFNNSVEFQNSFKNEIENGINFNTALRRSIAANLADEDVEEILNKPNNILAIEYLTAIKKLNANINLIMVERCDNGFSSKDPCGKFLSATKIREMILEGQDYNLFIPKNANLCNIFNKNHIKTLKTMQILKIRQTSASEIAKHYDYSEGIEFKIKKEADIASDLNDLVESVATARYRKPRINKLLLYPILGITKKILTHSKTTKPVVKLLAISKENKSLLTSFNKSKFNLVVTNKDYENLNKKQKEIYDIDLRASEIYRTILGENKNDKKIGTLFV